LIFSTYKTIQEPINPKRVSPSFYEIMKYKCAELYEIEHHQSHFLQGLILHSTGVNNGFFEK